MVVFHVMSADQELVSCDGGEEFYEMKNSCSSDSIDLDVEVNSSVRTEVVQCTIGDISSERCAKPRTLLFYDLLFIDRMTKRLGYTSQCALEGSWLVEQNDIWRETPLGAVEIYRSDDWGITATVNGSLLAYVPLCSPNFVYQPVKVNFTLDSLNQVGVEGMVIIPSVIGSMVGTVLVEYKLDGWWDYSWEEAVASSVTFPLKVFGSVYATEILLEHPSINGLTAVKSNAVSARLNISELGEISDFSFSMEDSSFCDGSFFGIDLCPYIEEYIYNSYGSNLHESVLMYAEIGFADFQRQLAAMVLNSTYTEIDFWGLKTACSIIDCDGLTLNEFAERLLVVAWIHVGLVGVLGSVLCCVCVLWHRSKRLQNVTKPNLKIESNPLLDVGEESGNESGQYGSVVDLTFKSVA